MARGFTLIYALVAMLAVGCASGGDRDGSGGGQQQPAGGTAPAVGGFGGAGGTGPADGAGGSGGTGGGRGGAGGQGDSDGWCAVEAILEQRCSECHGSAPAFGAPMSLVTHDDLTAESPNGGGRHAYEVALARLTGEETPQMPPPSNPQLTEDELATFQAWVEAGAPEANDCDVGTGGTGDSGGPPSVDEVPWPYSCEPDEGKPMQFLAHNNPTPGDTTPFDASHVGGAATGNDPNLYQCFHFKAPWADGKQGLGFKPVIDNSRILHHWLLYASDNAPPGMTDGGMVSDCQLQGDENRTLLAGWAPGTPGQNMPPDVGMELPAGDRGFITLEVHYYNTSPGEPANDRSGVELCIANENRPHTAAQHWLGTENINVPPNAAATASDTCTPMLAGDETSTIISVTPHMHKIGTHAKLELLNPDGTTKKVLHDAPFDFEYQTTYTFPEPVTMHAGEKLKATCEYKNTGNAIVNFGEGSDEEMCYLFTTAYPAGSLHNGRNGCFFEFCVPGGIHRCIDNENILTALGGL